ncbi:MAG: hypothetical protein Q8M24_21565 [Pseudolabrys sp.]|nr:hypothetical protein [Pseudolabrys sp.]MDP2298038.1 hypothetical protein [Pseudolabrys sp.]
MAGADTIERLQLFLRELSPQAQGMLIAEFERTLLRGEELGAADLVLQELRRIAREARDGAPRIGHSARLFFKPLEPFLVDDLGQHRHLGRISRSSLDTLWTWISRDVLPEDARAVDDIVNAAMLEGDDAKAQHFVRAFQDRVAIALTDQLRNAETDDKMRRRMLAQIGTQRASEDAATLKCVLNARDGLSAMAARLPLQVGNLSAKQLDECKALIEKTSPPTSDVFLYSLLTVMHRLAAPWQLIRLGVKAAGSDTAARVAETPYGVSVTIVLSELERQVGELRDDLRSGRGVAVGALLKTIHDSARGLRTELNMPMDSSWGRALSGLRSQIGDMLRLEIDSMPGRVRRLLKPRANGEIRPNSTLDPAEAAETEALVAFVGTCRHFAGELAINEMTQRTFSELQQYLDSATRGLLEALRGTTPNERSFRQSQVDTAVRLCATVFGRDYAAQLGKAAEVAAAADRKAAKG